MAFTEGTLTSTGWNRSRFSNHRFPARDAKGTSQKPGGQAPSTFLLALWSEELQFYTLYFLGSHLRFHLQEKQIPVFVNCLTKQSEVRTDGGVVSNLMTHQPHPQVITLQDDKRLEVSQGVKASQLRPESR